MWNKVKYPAASYGAWPSLSFPPQGAGYLHPKGTYPRGIRQISARARLLG